MNSDEERELFESWGWEYNYVKRIWSSPDGNVSIPLDDLVEYSRTRANEEELKRVVAMYGRR